MSDTDTKTPDSSNEPESSANGATDEQAKAPDDDRVADVDAGDNADDGAEPESDDGAPAETLSSAWRDDYATKMRRLKLVRAKNHVALLVSASLVVTFVLLALLISMPFTVWAVFQVVVIALAVLLVMQYLQVLGARKDVETLRESLAADLSTSDANAEAHAHADFHPEAEPDDLPVLQASAWVAIVLAFVAGSSVLVHQYFDWTNRNLLLERGEAQTDHSTAPAAPADIDGAIDRLMQSQDLYLEGIPGDDDDNGQPVEPTEEP